VKKKPFKDSSTRKSGRDGSKKKKSSLNQQGYQPWKTGETVSKNATFSLKLGGRSVEGTFTGFEKGSKRILESGVRTTKGAISNRNLNWGMTRRSPNP